MLHQLLFALIGKSGTIIRSDNKGFMVDRSLNLFKDQQISLINQIVQVGYNYRLLTNFIQSETCLIDYSISQSRRQPSIYRQALATGLQKYLQNYTALIQSIQQHFLQNKHFTIASIKAQIAKYELLFPQISLLLARIINQNMRGGKMADFVHETYQKANIWLREVLHIILQEFYKVFINQVISWLLYGEIIDKNGEFFVHRVTFQPTHKFKFNNKNIRQVDITDWQMYTIESNMIPKVFLKHSTAGKILFIGKSTKILKNCEKIQILPSNESLDQARKLQNTHYGSYQLQQTIEKVRYNIAQKMISLIMQEQNFLKEFEKVNEYYLMTRGDFYQLLLEQSRGIDKVANIQKAQKKLNQQYLQSTLTRLKCEQDSKKINFQLRPLGFHFQGFKTFNQLCPVGSIDLIDGKSVRFNDGALWHKTKQLIENDFHMSYVFRFKRVPKFFKIQNRQESKQNQVAVFSLVIQNCQQVLPNSHANPQDTKRLQEYISIDVGIVLNQKQTQAGCFLHLVSYNSRVGKRVKLAEKQIKKLNFMDGRQYILKVNYHDKNQKDNLKVSIGIQNSNIPMQLNQISIDLNIPFYVNLEMGRAHVGFISNLLGSNFNVQIDNWDMMCTAPNHYGDHWSDLCLSYKTKWPLDLVVTHDLLQNFSRVHKFLFPMRQTQIDLQYIWKAIPRRMKLQKVTSKRQKSHLSTFQRRISSFRARMCFVISQLWKYFQSDIIETTWTKLKESLTNTDDFESLIKMVNKYIKSIQTMFYFNVPKIQKIINQIVKHCKEFIQFFKKIQSQKIDEETYSQLEQIKDNFDDTFNNLVFTLKQLAVASSSHHLSQLSQRMMSCSYNKELGSFIQ